MFDDFRRYVARSIIIDRPTLEDRSIINRIARERSEENYRFAARFVSGKSVLDIGGGRGVGHAELLAANPSRVISLDLKAYSPDRRIQDPRLEYRQGDFLKEIFFDNSFDVVICIGTLFYLSDHEFVLSRIRRFLAPEGVLIINCINQDLVKSFFGMPLQNIDNKFTDSYGGDDFFTLLKSSFGTEPKRYHQQPVKKKILESKWRTPQLWLAAFKWIFSRHPIVPAVPEAVGMYNYAVVVRHKGA